MKRIIFVVIFLFACSIICLAAETNLQSTKVIEGLKGQIGKAGRFITFSFENDQSPTDQQVATWNTGDTVTWEDASGGFSDPLTTRGDIIYRDASSTTRLPLGANGLVLKSDGTDISWQSDATGAGAGAFSDAGDPAVLNTPAKDVHIGDGADVLTGKLEIGGDADQPQLVIEGHSTQTSNIISVQNDADTLLFTVDNTGIVGAAGLFATAVGLDGVGAVDLDYGSADITDHTFITANAGDGSDVELPVGSIESDEILDGTILVGDMAVNSIDSDQYVDGSIDTAHYASGSVDATAMGADSVGESELIEAMNFTATGTWNFLDVGTGANGAWDLTIGNTGTYGALEIGNFGLYSSSFSAANLDLDKAILFRQQGNIGVGNDPGIEFAWMEQGNTVRMAIPESGVGNATAMIRSVTIAGPYTSTIGNAIVTGDQWTTYDTNLDFDTSGTGADLFVQDDIELEGTLFVSGGDIRLDSDDANPLIISATSQTASHTFDFPDDEIANLDIMIGDGAGSFIYAPMSSGATMDNAGAVTIVTNANLTGHVTSTGNATVLGSFTEAQLETAVSDDNPVFDGDIGSNVQAHDAELDTIAALTETNGNVMFVAGGVWTSDATPAIDGTDITNVTAAHAGTITWTGTSVLETGVAFQFGDATDATLTHTYANTGTNVSIAYSTAAMAVTGALTATNLSGSNTGDEASSSTTVVGVIEVATTAEIDAATSAVLAVSPDQLEDSDFGKRVISILVNDSTDLTTGDGKAYFRAPDILAGWSITAVNVARVAGTGTDTYQLRNVTQAADVLSSVYTFAADDLDADASGNLNTSEDDITLGDRFAIDVDSVGSSTTWMEFQITAQATAP